MLKLAKLGSAIIAIAIISGCSAKTDTAPAAKPYLEMTEAEQKIEIERFVALFNQQHMADFGKSDRLNTQHYGDAEKDLIYAVATYPKHVSAKQLKKAQKAIKLLQEKANICAQPEMVHITKLGIGYQLRMIDPSGKTLYESEACRDVDSASKLRGASAAR